MTVNADNFIHSMNGWNITVYSIIYGVKNDFSGMFYEHNGPGSKEIAVNFAIFESVPLFFLYCHRDFRTALVVVIVVLETYV